tara:strand:- start:374 stop:586 length:213 start_codon:yes stop_codon:yes gene_type:complete
MTNWLLVMSVCSVIHGNCLPSWEAGVYNSFYDCGTAGTIRTLNELRAVGPEKSNKYQIFVTFTCTPIQES